MVTTTRTEIFETAQQDVLDRHDLHATRHFLDLPVLAGGRAQVLQVGVGDPLVLLNGIALPAVMWAPLIAHLTGFTVHAVDLPGYGLTDPLPRLADHLRHDAMTFLEQTLDGLEIDAATIVANSLASRWAFWLAVDHPARVRALVHVGCPALAPGTSAPVPMRMLSSRLLGRMLMRLQPPSLQQVERLAAMLHQDPLPPEIANVILATECLPHFEPMFLATLHRLLRLRGAHPSMAITEQELSLVSHPNLLVFGRDDPMGSEAAGKRMQAALPHASLHMIKGGHSPWLDSPQQTADLITALVERSG